MQPAARAPYSAMIQAKLYRQPPAADDPQLIGPASPPPLQQQAALDKQRSTQHNTRQPQRAALAQPTCFMNICQPGSRCTHQQPKATAAAANRLAAAQHQEAVRRLTSRCRKLLTAASSTAQHSRQQHITGAPAAQLMHPSKPTQPPATPARNRFHSIQCPATLLPLASHAPAPAPPTAWQHAGAWPQA
jgi:hypothetical protein